MTSSDTVPVLRSIPTTAGVAELVRRRYGLDVTSCVLVRSFVNDVWEIRTSGDQRFVLKLYRHGGWTTDEVGWETDLVTHLVAQGLPVAAVRPMSDGEAVGMVRAGEGPRPYVLSEFVEGRKPTPPFTDELYGSFGRLAARMHEAGDTFRSDHDRRPGGLQGSPESSIERVEAALVDQPEARRLVVELGATAQARLDDLADRLDRGVRHGDVSLDNVHLTDRGLVLHDFDLAQVGWRIADLSGCLSTPFAASFLEGYREVRPVGSADLEALPWLRVSEIIQNLDFHLTQKPLWRGRESVAEGWVESGLEALRSAADQLA